MKPWTIVLGSIFLLIALFTWYPAGLAEPLLHDPHGFHDLRWGMSLGDRGELERKEFTAVHEGPVETMSVYELKGGAGPIGGVHVDLMRFFTINGKFIRAAVHYTGQDNHKQLLSYLQSEFGPLERSMAKKGYRVQCVWMGEDTEIMLTYNYVTDRGYLFFESRNVRPNFIDLISEHGY